MTNIYFENFLNKNKKEIENIYNIIFNKLSKSVFNIISVEELILHLELDKNNLNKFKEMGFENNPFFDKNSICFVNSKADSECLIFYIEFKKKKVTFDSLVLSNSSIKAKLNEKETTFYFNKLISNYGYLSNFDFLSFKHENEKIIVNEDCDFTNMYFYCKESILKKDDIYVILEIFRAHVENNEKEILDFLICNKAFSKDFLDVFLLKNDIDLTHIMNKIYIPDLNLNINTIKIDINKNNNIKEKL